MEWFKSPCVLWLRTGFLAVDTWFYLSFSSKFLTFCVYLFSLKLFKNITNKLIWKNRCCRRSLRWILNRSCEVVCALLNRDLRSQAKKVPREAVLKYQPIKGTEKYFCFSDILKLNLFYSALSSSVHSSLSEGSSSWGITSLNPQASQNYYNNAAACASFSSHSPFEARPAIIKSCNAENIGAQLSQRNIHIHYPSPKHVSEYQSTHAQNSLYQNGR